MMKRSFSRALAFLLTLLLAVGTVIPVAAEVQLEDYRTFLSNLEDLEDYAKTYASSTGKNADLLMANFIRTGVDRYTTSSWTTMCGAEETAFVEFVEQQDAALNTSAMDLRDLTEFYTPNGQKVDFEHMFGALNMALYNKNNADLGSWAGDLCDLLVFTKGELTATDFEEMVTEIRTDWLGVDDYRLGVSGFGTLDIYGDLDAFYFAQQVRSGVSLASAVGNYYTTALSDEQRAAYFLNNRFDGLETKEDVRTAIYDTYKKDVGVSILEAGEGMTEEDSERRIACCYAFADYLYDLAADLLEGGSGDSPDEPGTNPDDPEQEGDNKYYSVFSTGSSTLAPGVVQTISYALTADKEQIVYYTATVDLSLDTVGIMANYKNHDPSLGWGMARVEDQVKDAQKYHGDPNSENYIENFNVIAGVNGDFYNTYTGKPSGAFVMDGVQYNSGSGRPFFAILKDGTPVIGSSTEWDTYSDQIAEAVGGSAVVLRDGVVVGDNSGRASRTAVGITADGKVVLMVLDGRQSPFSAGGSMAEIAQILLDAGCVIGMNLDGGGSSTFVAKQEGEDEISLVNRPSDGYARSVSSSLVVYSTAKSSKEFDHANISSDYEYLTVNTELQLTAVGVSNTGYSATIPEGAYWAVSDDALASIDADGLFTAKANGDVKALLMLGDTIIGEKELHVVTPDALGFDKPTMTAIYGIKGTLPLKAYYNGNLVAVNAGDFFFALQYNSAGYINGFEYYINEDCEYRSILAGAALLANFNVQASIVLNMYKDGEAYFDFDNATAGRDDFAWNRDVTNSETDDGLLFHILDNTQDTEISYTFAIDMTKIEIPEKLTGLTSMLPGSDLGDKTAWAYMLELAERVSTLTEVRIEAWFDSDLQVDISNMKIVNEYFVLSSVTIDESNKLTIVANWVDQTMAINPATANPVCILSGIKLSVPDDANWNSADRLPILNMGEVSYNIFLRANQLYSFASVGTNQEEYGLIPFINPNDPNEKGASFGSTYATFTDSITLDRSLRQGWHTANDHLYYYVDGVVVTGVQKLPSYEDPSVELFYDFDTDGSCKGTLTGLFEKEGKFYYAVMGEQKTGWISVLASNGSSNFYYFDPSKGGAALDGQQTINTFKYTFENYILVRGEIREHYDGEFRYRFAGMWLRNQWLQLDGNNYFIKFDYFLARNGMFSVRTIDGTSTEYLLFDENCVWRNDISGLYMINGTLGHFENGVSTGYLGLVFMDGYYYYFRSNGQGVVNQTYWITKTNDLLPQGSYVFDENGRMVVDLEDDTELEGIVELNGKLYFFRDGLMVKNAGLMKLDDTTYIYVRTNGELATGVYWPTKTNDLLPYAGYDFGTDGKYAAAPVVPDEPDVPVEPEIKDGIVEEGGKLWYYVNGVKQINLGLVKLDDTTYIYVRTNGQLAVGNYWPTKTNDLLPYAGYDFGTDGKYVAAPIVPDEPDVPVDPDVPVEPEVKEGVYEENGSLYYYVNGVKQKNIGLVQLDDGAYIYVRSNGQLAVGNYWPTKTNDLLPYAGYDFGTDGRLYI